MGGGGGGEEVRCLPTASLKGDSVPVPLTGINHFLQKLQMTLVYFKMTMRF